MCFLFVSTATAVEDDEDDEDDEDSDDFSDNDNDEEMIDEENKDFGLKSLLEEDENKQSQVSQHSKQTQQKCNITQQSAHTYRHTTSKCQLAP